MTVARHASSSRCLCRRGIHLLQITRLGDRIGKLSPMQRKLGIRRILGAVSEAYGRMMLYEGLFQADGHPGNILVMKGDVLLMLCMVKGTWDLTPAAPQRFLVFLKMLCVSLTRQSQYGCVGWCERFYCLLCRWQGGPH